MSTRTDVMLWLSHVIGLRYQLLSLTTKAKNLTQNSGPLFPGASWFSFGDILAFHHTILDGLCQNPSEATSTGERFQGIAELSVVRVAQKRLGAAKVKGLFCTPRLSVALSSPLKMSTKALAAIAKVKSDHILKVTLQMKLLIRFVLNNSSFVYLLEHSAARIKAKGNRPSPRRLCCSKVKGEHK